MAAVSSKRSVMTFYSDPESLYSHRARMVLAEKNITVEIIDSALPEQLDDLMELNPYGELPTLVDRDLVLYDSRIIMEYLDDRFPHPPLHEMDPVSRANSRMIIKRIDQDWYQLLDEIQNSGEKKSARAKKMLKESLISAAPVFEAHPYFMSDEFSLIDCAIAPLLWRLPSLGIDINSLGTAITVYANRLFSREAFQESLSEAEKEMAPQQK